MDALISICLGLNIGVSLVIWAVFKKHSALLEELHSNLTHWNTLSIFTNLKIKFPDVLQSFTYNSNKMSECMLTVAKLKKDFDDLEGARQFDHGLDVGWMPLRLAYLEVIWYANHAFKDIDQLIRFVNQHK